VLAVVFVAAVQAAAGDTVEHVNVNGGGRNSTNSFAKTLFVDSTVVSGYTHHSNDGDEGTWDGPGYHATLKPTMGGMTSIGWGVTFDIASHVTPADLAKRYALNIGSWQTLQQGAMSVPHLVGGAKVGMLRGVMLLTQAPGSNAASFKSAVAFPLCKGVIAVAHFSSLGPANNNPHPFGMYVVDDGTDVQPWTRDHVRSSLDGVALNGFLPVTRLTAAARGRSVHGVVSDCVGHPMPGVTVKVGTVSARTTPAGAYTARVARAGAVVVSVSAGGATARRTIRVR